MPRGLFGQAPKDEPTLTASSGSQTHSSDQDRHEFTIRRENDGQANDKGRAIDIHTYKHCL